MGQFRWLRQSGLGQRVMRFLAGIAFIAQCSALFAPLGDTHAAPTPALSSLVSPTAALSLDAPQPASQHHDATTCPACIAQSIVAHQSATVLSIVFDATVERLDPLERIHAPHSSRTTLPPSRGPPATS